MQVDDTLIDKLAKLSKLSFNSEEARQEIKSDLTKILGFMEKLNELNTDGVEPLIYINEDSNVFRNDEVKYYLTKEEALANAPIKNEDYILVPKFVNTPK